MTDKVNYKRGGGSDNSQTGTSNVDYHHYF